MGGGDSKQARLERYGELLSGTERKALSNCFHTISGSQEQEQLTLKQLQAYITSGGVSLSSDIVKRLYSALSVLQEPGKSLSTTLPSPTFSSFIQQTAWALKGSNSQKASFLFTLSRGSVQLLESTLVALLTALLDGNALHDVLPSLKQWPSNVESLSRLVSHSFLSLKRNQDSDTLTVTDLQSWLSTTPIPVRAIDLTLVLLFLLPFSSVSDLANFFGSVDTSPEQLLIPLKTRHPVLHEKFSSELLDHSALLLLNSALPYECRGYLYPLFSSRIHGESFSTLCRQILDRGPTLIVVCDKGGHIFGGFASDKWMCHPQFTGSSSCFLFSLFPTMGVYSPTGYNDNYMYMQQSAQTMPNGIGMGGQLEYFGLWLSADYGKGHSKARPKCSTFGSPMLSSYEEFEIDLLEAWGVGEPVLDEEDETDHRSILDKDKSAQVILDLAGKTRHSEGLREPDSD